MKLTMTQRQIKRLEKQRESERKFLVIENEYLRKTPLSELSISLYANVMDNGWLITDRSLRRLRDYFTLAEN